MSSDYMPQMGSIPARVISFLYLITPGAEVTTSAIGEAIDADPMQIVNSTGAAVAADLCIREKHGVRYLWRRGSRIVPQEFLDAHPIKDRSLLVLPVAQPDKMQTVSGRSFAEQVNNIRVLSGASEPDLSMLQRRDALVIPPVTKTLREEDEEVRQHIGDDNKEENSPDLETIDVSTLAKESPRQTRKYERRAAVPDAVPQAPRGYSRDLRVGIFSDGSLVVEHKGRVEVYDPDEVTILVRFLDRMMLKNGSIQP